MRLWVFLESDLSQVVGETFSIATSALWDAANIKLIFFVSVVGSPTAVAVFAALATDVGGTLLYVCEHLNNQDPRSTALVKCSSCLRTV